jgi:hypothetical protein
MPALLRSKTVRWAPLAVALVASVVMAQTGVASADSGGGGGGGRWADNQIFPFHHPGSFHGHPVPVGQVQVIASGLNQPKKITIAPDGSLLVALSGDAVAPASCTDGGEASCLDTSGAIVRVTPSGHVSTVVGNLPSVSSGGEGASATGPVEAISQFGGLQVLFQNTDIDPTTGQETYGPGGALLGDLVKYGPFGGGTARVEAAFGPFEAANNPDHGEGTAVQFGEPAIDSDPYSFVPYRGGYAVADAAGDDLLYVSPWGHISVLAVFPTIPETAPPGDLGPTQTTPVPVDAQPVPTAVAVGPDGALYVGELGGDPFNVGSESIYRVVPGQATKVVASGLTTISDIAFDHQGRLLALEIDQAGLDDPALPSGGLPTPGAIIRVGWNGQQTVVASTGLEFPTGLAVGPGNVAYVSNFGVVSATGGPGGVSGEVVSVGLPW